MYVRTNFKKLGWQKYQVSKSVKERGFPPSIVKVSYSSHLSAIYDHIIPGKLTPRIKLLPPFWFTAN